MTKQTISVSDSSTSGLSKKIFIGMMLLMCILMGLLSQKAGINQDERYRVPLLETFSRFYTSFGANKDFLEIKFKDYIPARIMVDFITHIPNVLLGNDPQDLAYHKVRHFVLAMIGFLGILFTGLCAQRLGGWQAACLAAFLIFISPVFLGHSMINPRDLPFATFYIFSIYFLIRYIETFPNVSNKTILFLAIGIILALNVRVGGYLLLFYTFIVFAVLWYIHRIRNKNKVFDTKRLIKQLLVLSVVVYFGALIFWPYGLTGPFTKPLANLAEQTDFPTKINQLFEGKSTYSLDLPWYYLFKSIIISIPISVLIGLLLLVPMLYLKRKTINWKVIGILVLATVFPLLYITYADANVYNGWRHVLFIYPPRIILAAMGWLFVLQIIRKNWAPYLIGALVLLTSLDALLWIAKNPSYIYMYYNPLVGGFKNAYDQYETDYWATSVTEAALWLKDQPSKPNASPIIVRSNGAYGAGVVLLDDNKTYEVKQGPYYESSRHDWDYNIAYIGYINEYHLKKRSWPPEGTIHEIKVDGLPICAVIKREEGKNDLKGFNELEKQDIATAISSFNKYLEYDPDNATVLAGLGFAYVNSGNISEAIKVLNRSLRVYPEYSSAMFPLGIAQLQSNNPRAAILTLKRLDEIKPGDRRVYQVMGDAYNRMGDKGAANYYYNLAKGIGQKRN